MDKHFSAVDIYPVLQDIEKGMCRAILKKNVWMRDLCTFRIGGQAAYVLTPCDISSFLHIARVLTAQKIPYYVWGGGSNILPSDDRFCGVILSTRRLNGYHINGRSLTAECGVFLNSCILSCADACMSGWEPLYGIPGTVGGALRMNAGANGREIGDSLEWAEIFDPVTGECFRLSRAEMRFSYRHSYLQAYRSLIAVRACFSMTLTAKKDSITIIQSVMRKRRLTQPIEYPSAGSVFRRPAPHIEVWRLIDACGMRGMTCGGAQISEKHAGFIINRQNATAADVRFLIDHIIHRVQDTHGILLKPEVEIL